MKLFKQHWVLFTIISCYWLLTGVLIFQSVQLNHGKWVYPLDDTYIHMAIAKHFSQTGTWSLATPAFSSATSSPLWTLLVAVVFFIFGIHETLPLFLALFFGTALLTVAYFFLKTYALPQLLLLLILALAMLATPLPSLTVSGMEHVLHALLVLSLVFVAVRILTNPAPPAAALVRWLLGLACLAPLVRFESLFLLLLLAILLSWQKHYYLALLLLVSGLLPISAYGLYSMARGWFFLPTSILLKGNLPAGTWEWYLRTFSGAEALSRLATTPATVQLFLAALAAILLAGFSGRGGKERSWPAFIFVSLVVLHMQFAKVGWFFRYEAYLVFLGSFSLGAALAGEGWKAIQQKVNLLHPPTAVAAVLALLMLLYPLGGRALAAFRIAPQASHNIYEQQYQMGLFLQRGYSRGCAAVNDCGAVCFLSEARIVDIWGIGTLEFASAKLKHAYTSDKIDWLVRRQGADIALIYDSWLAAHGGVPKSWQKVGMWRIPNNQICGDDKVSFYAIQPASQAYALEQLKNYSRQLPADVQQTGRYMDKNL